MLRAVLVVFDQFVLQNVNFVFVRKVRKKLWPFAKCFGPATCRESQITVSRGAGAEAETSVFCKSSTYNVINKIYNSFSSY